ADKQVKLRQLELSASKVATSSAVQPDTTHASSPSPRVGLAPEAFDVSRHIALVPQFRETEVDTYFSAFERIATSLRWPKEVWSLLLQCRLFGKAQEVCYTLSLEESLKYESVKSAILRAYELVPEAYRQRFRKHKKSPTQTFVEFAREKGVLFDKWCTASKVSDFDSLRELILLEEFKGCVSERVVVYLNEQKVTTLSHAAVLADEFVLTHKNVFSSARPEKLQFDSSQSQTSRSRFSPPHNKEERECFYCHKKGHVIADCLALKRKQQPQPKSVGLVKAFKSAVAVHPAERIDESYRPFVSKGLISLSGKREDQEEVRILRDTGAMQSFILAGKLQLSDKTFCGTSVIVQGIEMGCVRFPLHRMHLQSELCSGFVRAAVSPSLPVKGVDVILRNDLAGGKVMPVIEVVDEPDAFCELEALSETYPDVFPACAVTRAQSRRVGDVVDLSNSFMFPLLSGDTSLDMSLEKENSSKTENKDVIVSDADILKLPVSRERIIAAQKEDKTLVNSFNSAIALDVAKDNKVAYFIDNDLLMRKWCSHVDKNFDWNVVYQIVVPFSYRQHVLCLAHDHQLAGHLGVTKTYNR
uniref:CCHC-type domain-containing protein n=1 Tax=Sinocyclocheilus anshuiensis TaxID=1608454 RepID=A0A671PSE2_9TELE